MRQVTRRPGVSRDANGYPVYPLGWKDSLTSINSAKVSGANVPAWTLIRDGLYAYSFTATALKEVWLNFHIGHDYAPGTDLYPHVHYVPLTDEVQGVIRWGFEFSYADRGGTFGASQTVYIEETIAANSQYDHIVSEVTDANALDGSDWTFEVDGVLLCRVFRDGAHVNDTYAGDVGGIFVDLHYQSDRDTTINKAAPFRG